MIDKMFGSFLFMQQSILSICSPFFVMQSFENTRSLVSSALCSWSYDTKVQAEVKYVTCGSGCLKFVICGEHLTLASCVPKNHIIWGTFPESSDSL